MLGTTFRQWGSQGGGWGMVGVPGETNHCELLWHTIERSVKHVLFASLYCFPNLRSSYILTIWIQKNANFANLYVSIFGYVGDEGGVVLLDEEGGEKAWTQTIPAVWTIVN